MKMFLKKNKPDKSEMAKYICSKHPIEKNTIQFRDNDCKWIEQYNSAYNGAYEIPIKKSNSKTEDNDDDDAYTNVIIDGSDDEMENDHDHDHDHEYDFDITSLNGGEKRNSMYYLAMRICISEYNFQTPLSYYYIDTKDIPNKYEYDFKKYKII